MQPIASASGAHLRSIASCFPPRPLYSLPNAPFTNPAESNATPVDTGEDVHHLKPLRAYGWNQTMDEALFIPTAVLCNDMGLLVIPNNHDYQVRPKDLL
jgi:hypothetical protein